MVNVFLSKPYSWKIWEGGAIASLKRREELTLIMYVFSLNLFDFEGEIKMGYFLENRIDKIILDGARNPFRF